MSTRGYREKAAIVTGACGGIGKALCDEFSGSGYIVIGVDLERQGEFRHPFVRCDLRRLGKDPATTGRFLDEIEVLGQGRIEVVINNAAVQIVKPFTEITPEDWASTIDTNLMAPFWLTKMLYPELKRNRGSVVNISSIHADLTKKHFAAYATSKGALVTLTRALALELAPEVRINVILPAATDTPMLRAGFEGNPKGFAALERYHPLGRIALPEEIAQVALFLAGPGARFMTGAVVDVDGGVGCCLKDPG